MNKQTITWEKNVRQYPYRNPTMNAHIIVEDTPHALRNAILSATLSCGIFFTLGLFGREIWDYHTKEPVKECQPVQAKKSMKWTE